MEPKRHNFVNRIMSTGNILLMKSEVGKVRPSIHKLPSADFVYGKNISYDEIGAREMIKCWKYHKNSEKVELDVDFKRVNALGVKNGLSTSMAFRSFKKKQTNFVRKKSAPIKKIDDLNFTYGKALRPSTPMKAIMTNFYGNYAEDSLDKIYSCETPAKLYKCTDNTNFNKTQPKLEPKTKELFKMRKFLKVSSKTNCWKKQPTQ